MDRGGWLATVHGITESDMTERQMSDRYYNHNFILLCITAFTLFLVSHS